MTGLDLSVDEELSCAFEPCLNESSKKGIMSKSFEQILEEQQRRVAQDEPIEHVIASLHAEGLTITDSMKAVRSLYGVDLGIAKELVSSHPVWAKVVEANEPLHALLRRLVQDWPETDNGDTVDVDAMDAEGR